MGTVADVSPADRATTGSDPKATGGSRDLQVPPRTADSLDALVATTTTGGWIALVVALIGMVAAGVWAFVAEIPQVAQDSAVTSNPGSADVVVAPAAGTSDTSVTPGDAVTAGQTVAVITPFDGGTPVNVTAPRAGVVLDSSTVDGAGVQPGDELLVIDSSADGASTLATTFVPANRAQLYTPDSEIEFSWTDLSSGQSYRLPGKVEQVFNVPADESAIESTARSLGVARTITADSDDLLYRVQLSVEQLDSVPADARPVDGQVLDVTNTYARPHPIQLLFGGTS